jgi:hypothetical protein
MNFNTKEDAIAFAEKQGMQRETKLTKVGNITSKNHTTDNSNPKHMQPISITVLLALPC